ncbi:methyl-accepting chemotaxis protein, partial [Salmonella enterica]|nr:methyl-accepting chemotaxis protein [Salmonella enterica]
IRNDVKHQVDNMVTEYRGDISDTQNNIRGKESAVSRQYSELQNNHNQEGATQHKKYNDEVESQKILPSISEEDAKKMIKNTKERMKGPL